MLRMGISVNGFIRLLALLVACSGWVLAVDPTMERAGRHGPSGYFHLPEPSTIVM